MPIRSDNNKSSRRRFIVVVCVFAVVSTITHLLPLLSAPIEGAAYAEKVSLTLDGWMGVNRKVDDNAKAILETDDVVDRRYTKPGQPWVDLTIIFAREQRKVAHPQEICLKGAGYSIQEYSRPTIPTGIENPSHIPVVKLRIERDRSKHLVYYWYKCGSHYSSSYYWENILIITSRITLRPTNGALIKLTTPIDADQATSEKRLEDFLAVAMPEINEKLP